jgi:predicted Fe-S protein YdhL (DUF1289 family)
LIAAVAGDGRWDGEERRSQPRPAAWRWPSRTYKLEAMAAAEEQLASPCIRNCCLDDSEVCLGCGRHLQEILRWQQADAAERAAILARAAERRAARPPLRLL